MDRRRHRGWIQVSFGEQRLQALNNRQRGIAWGGQNLSDDHLSGLLIQQEKIGERAADIDTGAIPSCIHRSTLILHQNLLVSRQSPSRMIAEKRGSVNATGRSDHAHQLRNVDACAIIPAPAGTETHTTAMRDDDHDRD